MFGIYVIGANDIGKTTWCLDLKRYYKLPLITEVPNLIMERHNTNFAAVRPDAERITAIQREIFETQCETEEAQTGPYISDGAWNNLAFMCEWGLDGHDLFRSEKFQRYIEVVRKGLCFFLRPHPTLINRSDFETRSGTKRDAVIAIDASLKSMFELLNLRYLPVWTYTAQERRRTAEFCLGTPDELHALYKAVHGKDISPSNAATLAARTS